MNPVIWPTVTNGIGVSASPAHLLVTVPWCQTNNPPARQVLSLESMGTPHVFVTLPNQAGCDRQKVTISPGLPGFPANFVYVTQGGTILEITPDGSSIRVFAILPDASPGHVNVIFDQIGLFGHKRIATG